MADARRTHRIPCGVVIALAAISREQCELRGRRGLRAEPLLHARSDDLDQAIDV
jgi:hypothetical protein